MPRKRTRKKGAHHAERTYREGTIRIGARSTGYVTFEGEDDEIIVNEEHLNTALHGDRVRVLVRSDGKRGEVSHVITRVKSDFAGVLREKNGAYFVEPQDRRMYANIAVPKDKLGGAKPGEKVLAAIMRWSDPKKDPAGEVKEVIGEAGKHETEIRAIVLDRGLSDMFPKEILLEADAVKRRYFTEFEEEAAKRRDLRDIPTFTIDPENAKDFDDALSLRVLPNGAFEVGIHIADVTFFVRRGTALDKEAARRATSIYLVDRTIPMLPEVLSNDLASINPDEDKLTFSALFEMDKNGRVLKRWFGKTVIRSKKRFTYDEAHDALFSKEKEFHKELSALDAIAKKIREKRAQAGALVFEQGEVKFVLDEDGKPIRVYKKPRLETNKLIEDFMILANNEVAKFVATRDKAVEETFVYRVHDVPDEEKIAELKNLIRALGYTIPERRDKKRGPITPEDLNDLLLSVRGSEHEYMVEESLIRSMAKAIYTTKNIGHFGLSLKHYTHFTSPIRRYPDMMVHRLLSRYLAGKATSKDEWSAFEALSRYSTQMEIAANEAEWASIKYKQAEYMAERIGEEYEGIITGFTDHGFFVREDETLTEGMVRLRDLKDDYYVYEEKAKRVVGKRTKRAYTLGDRIKIRVVRVDVERRLVDYELLPS